MKQFDLQGNEYDIQIKEMLDNIPKSNNVASAYTGISVDELQTIIDKFKTIPNNNDLIADNNRKDKVINDLLKRISDLEFEVERLEKREKECIDHYLVQSKYASEMEDKYITEKYKNDKAIEYLKENACIDEDVEYFCDDLRYDECKVLLDILKGVDKE